MAHTSLLFLLLLSRRYLLALWLKDLRPALQTQRSKSTPFSLLQKLPQSVRGKSLELLRKCILNLKATPSLYLPHHHEKPLSNIPDEACVHTHTHTHTSVVWIAKYHVFMKKINKQFAFSKIKAWGR